MNFLLKTVSKTGCGLPGTKENNGACAEWNKIPATRNELECTLE